MFFTVSNVSEGFSRVLELLLRHVFDSREAAGSQEEVPEAHRDPLSASRTGQHDYLQQRARGERLTCTIAWSGRENGLLL